ncbi:phosphate acyltransferase PlsX [soil metagenome]
MAEVAIRVAVDAMGGDKAPEAVVEGAVSAIRNSPHPLGIVLTGPREIVEAALSRLDAEDLPIETYDAPDVIGMSEAPAVALKTKTRSSIHVGLGLCKAGAADAFASAGNTGAVMAGAVTILGRLPGVSRPTLPGYFPTPKGTCLVLDVGANVDCKPEHLVQFARMGAVYAHLQFQRDDPSVGVLNVGEEPGKGNELAKTVYNLLSQAEGLNFIGNVEGRDIFSHRADVVVCDGFVGNALLKLGESMASLLPQLVGEQIQRDGRSDDQARLIGGTLRKALHRFDYENFGGVPLLGVNGIAIVGHGGSSPAAIEQMILRAREAAAMRLTERLTDALAVQA